MRRRLPHSRSHWAALLVALASLSCAAQQDPTQRFVERLRARTPQLLVEHGIPGAAFAVVNRDSVVFSGGFGSRSEDGPEDVDSGTLFSIGSITKVFVGMAVLQAAQDGSLDLDQPITRWLPEFRIPTRFAPHPEQRITLRHLLSHRAGIGVSAPVGNFMDSLSAPIDAHVESLADTWLRHPVGEYTAYSNPGFGVAARALEVATGEELDEFVRARIFAPTGMERSQLSAKEVEAASNRAIGHGAQGPYPVFLPVAAAGGIYSSADDMARYLQLRLRNGTSATGRLLEEPLLTAQQTIPFPVSDVQTSGYGLGLGVSRIRMASGEFIAHGHNGGGAGFQSSLSWVPALGLGYVVLQNYHGEDALLDEFRSAFGEALETLAESAPLEAAHAPPEARCIEHPLEALGRFEGTYQGRSRTLVLVNQSNGLHLYPGGKPLCLVSDSDVVVVGSGFADAYRFRFDPDGRPQSIVGLNSGKAFHYNDGPGDERRTLTPGVEPSLGVYALTLMGRQQGHVVVRQQRGHVYVDDARFLPGHESGIFFSGAGHVLDLRPPRPSWRVIPLSPVDRHFEESERAALIATTRRFADRMGEGDLEAALSELAPRLRTEAVRQGIQAAWDPLVKWFGPYTHSPRAEIWPLPEGARVDLWARFGTRDVMLRFELNAESQVRLVLLGRRNTWWASVPAEAP